MIYHGKNLIISKDGQPLYAAKSCDLNVQAESIPKSSPSDGAWKYSTVGRKSWTLATNHLVATPRTFDGHIIAKSYGWSGATPNPFVIDGTGARKEVSLRGISAITMRPSAPYDFVYDDFTTWDTYATDPDELMSSFGSFMENNSNAIVALVTKDSFRLPQSWIDVITTYAKVTPPACGIRNALTVLGSQSFTSGICTHASRNSNDVGFPAVAEIFLYNGAILNDTPMKDAIATVGGSYTIKCSVRGMLNDEVSGTAICKQFRVMGNIDNMMQGSFSWEGSGPLE